MEQISKRLTSGKLEMHLLEGLLQKYRILDPQIVVGPKIGEDAAVIDPGAAADYYWVVTSDPVTFATEEIGYYGVVVNANDIATRGAKPKWFLATLLFPQEETDLDLVEKVFHQIHQACLRFGISFVGGHTEITPGIPRVILSGHMIGEVAKDRLVTTGGAKEGDLIVLVKGVCIEGTSILARERETELLSKGIPSSLIARAKSFIFDPGIDILRPALRACDALSVHSMHDPTEGGLINGIVEMALASGKELEVDLKKVYIYDESRILCNAYGLDPLGVIASGALLLTISPAELPRLEVAFQKDSIPFQVIGKVREGTPRVVTTDGGEIQALRRDEILKIY